MSHVDPRLAPAMIDAVRAGAGICRAVQATLVAGDSIKTTDKSPVTVADLAATAYVPADMEERVGD